MRKTFTTTVASALIVGVATLVVAPSARASASISYSTTSSAFSPDVSNISDLGNLDPNQAGNSYLLVLFQPNTHAAKSGSDVLLGSFQVSVGDVNTSVIGTSNTVFDLGLSQSRPKGGNVTDAATIAATITTDVAFTESKKKSYSDQGSYIDITFAQPVFSVGGVKYILGTGTGSNFTPLPGGVLSLKVPGANGTATTDLRAEILSDPEPATIVSASLAGLMGVGFAWRRRKSAAA